MTSENTSCGFCYVANTAEYMDEAMRSLASLREQMPTAKVCVIAPKALWRMDAPVDDWREPTLQDRTPIVKNDATLAPYARVAFVDTDTYFAAPLLDVFDILEGFDLAAAHEPTRGWDYKTPAAPAFCELNTGFIVFRNTAKTRAFFDLWLAEYRQLNKERGLRNDQPSFRNSLWRAHEIRVATLPSEYHCVVGKPSAIAWEARLLHGRSRLKEIAQDINSQTGYRCFIEGLGLVFPYCGRKAWIKTWLRLSWRFLRILVAPRQLLPTDEAPKPHQWHLGETGLDKKPKN